MRGPPCFVGVLCRKAKVLTKRSHAQRSPKQKVESLKIMAFFKQTFLQTKISIISSKVMK